MSQPTVKHQTWAKGCAACRKCHDVSAKPHAQGRVYTAARARAFWQRAKHTRASCGGTQIVVVQTVSAGGKLPREAHTNTHSEQAATAPVIEPRVYMHTACHSKRTHATHGKRNATADGPCRL
jgi:hypothetical protein